MNLEEPECEAGYPVSQLHRILGDDELNQFILWMEGQTAAICDGRLYDHELGDYYPSPCADHPHGVVYYRDDLKRFINKQPIID